MGITFDSDALTLGILVNASDALGSPAAPLFPQLLLNYVCFFFHKSHQLGMIRESQKLLPWTFCHTLQHGVGEEWRGGGARNMHATHYIWSSFVFHYHTNPPTKIVKSLIQSYTY